ncbi:hypothetical protein ACIHFD_04780 [Nonomuraea sp. NPDC051941]|uniref:hypothetical protein n=1 Tax=Nonomuraea sp. NPDC051941 TaxID=3364373 RepID=UPI0037C9181F
MTQLIAEIKRLQQSFSEADAQIQGALSSIGTTVSGPGLLKDIGFQAAQHVPSLQRRLDLIISTQKIGLDKGVVWADETLWVSSSPASGAAAAKSVADRLRQAGKDVSASSKEALGHEVLELLEKYQHDPYFAVAFAKEMPPKELKALLRDLYGRNPYGPGTSGSVPSPEVDRLLRVLSVTLGTASRGAGDSKLPKGYVDELIASDATPANGEIVDELLRYGKFDDAFLREVANKVFDNEQKPATERQEIVRFGPGLAAALANNPRVTQDFFTDPARRPLSFLMRENTWSDGGKELGRAIEAATRTFRDHGQSPETSRGYKSALIASWAVHFWADPKAQEALPDARGSATRIFSAYMSDVHRVANGSIPERPGVNPLPDSDSNLPGNQPYGAMFDRDELKSAMTWAAADPQAYKTFIEAHGEYSLAVLDVRAAKVADSIDSAFTVWQRRHPDATEAEQSEYRQELLKEKMATSSGTFNSQVYALSKSLFFAVDAGNLASIKEADRKDQINQAFTDGITRTGKLIITAAGDGASAIYEFAESYASDNIEFTEGEAARGKAEDKLVQSQELFKDMTANVMMRHGLFGDAAAPDSAHPHAFINSPKGSDSDFMVDGRIKPRSQMDSAEALAYEDWLTKSPASGIFKATADSVRDGFLLPVPPYPEKKE